MTRRNIEIKRIQDGTEYSPMPYGKYSGIPTVSIKLSSSDKNGIKVNSLENLFISRNWKRKITSGYSRLRIYGNDPFADQHRESLEYLFDVLDPRFIDMEIEDRFLDKQPGRFIQRRTDTYSFFIDLTKDDVRYDPDTLKHISSNFADEGNAQYIFKVDSIMCEDPIKSFREEYRVYNSDIWLYPKGRKRDVVEDNRETVENVAKRNSWNVSPRMDVLVEKDEEEAD